MEERNEKGQKTGKCYRANTTVLFWFSETGFFCVIALAGLKLIYLCLLSAGIIKA